MWLAGGKYAPTFPHQLRWLPNHAAVASQTRPPNPKVNRVVANITLHSTKPRTQAGPPPPCYIVNHPTLEGTEGKKNTGNAARTHTTDTAKPDQTRPDGGTDLDHVVHRAAPRVVLLHYMSYNSVVRPQSALLHTFIVVAATTTRSTERERHLLLRWSLPPSAMSVFHGRISWSGGLGMETPVRESTLLVYSLGERP